MASQDSEDSPERSARTVATPAPEPRLIDRLRAATDGEYTIVRELGRGGFATVYLARDRELDRDVAIKVLTLAMREDDPGTTGEVERFRREARTAGKLSHPNIIPIYAVKATKGLQYFVMKYVRGRPLDNVVHSAGALPLALVQTILTQAGNALAYAHRQGVVHRDVKPANIMLDEDGWAVVADFGIAKVARADKLTATGMIVGTAAYMSPEQWAGQDVSGLSDEYSLGIVAYELLTGKPPFTGETVPALLWSHLNEIPAPIAETRPDCPEELSRIVMRMLEKDPAARWPHLDEAVAAITALPMPQTHEDTRTQLISLATVGLQSGEITEPISGHTPVTPSNRVARLTLSPPEANVSVSASMRVQVSALNDTGKQLARRVVSWRSGDIAVATVDADGVVSARGPGRTSIFAMCEGVEISMPVVVTGERAMVVPRRGRRNLWIAGGVCAAAIAVFFAIKQFGVSPPPVGSDKRGDSVPPSPAPAIQSPTPTSTQSAAGAKQQVESRGGRGGGAVIDSGKKPVVTPPNGSQSSGAVVPKPDSAAGRAGAGAGGNATGAGAGGAAAPPGTPPVGSSTADPKPTLPAERGSAPPPTASVDATPSGPMFAELSAGGVSTCAAMTNNSDVLCWGAGALLGEAVSGIYFEKLAVGGSHACGIAPDGAAYCWGDNTSGQLGDNTTIAHSTPAKVKTAITFKSISVGGSHSCGLAQDGTAWCWGANRNGQLGDGSSSTRKTPVQVKANETFQSLSAGGAFTCGVRKNKAYCWGAGFSGQLGNAMPEDKHETFPVRTSLNLNNVVTGREHTCALSNGHAYCWGSNAKGQLGNDTKDDRNVPDSVTTDLIFRQLSAGATHTCGVTTSGVIACWGENSSGQLGDSTRAAKLIPVHVAAKGVTWKQVSAGTAHTCAIAKSDRVYCWGTNTQGQLGTGVAGGLQIFPTPIKVGLPGK